jgi:hypothetical protein
MEVLRMNTLKLNTVLVEVTKKPLLTEYREGISPRQTTEK